MQKALVIGAGFAGMASAIILAKRGYAVTLVEQAARPGMTLRGFKRKGLYFESGLHYVGELSEGGILKAYLNWLGLGDIPLTDFDPACFETVRYADGSCLSLPVGQEPVTEALVRAFPHEEKGILGYMRELREAYDASPFHSFTGSLEGGGEHNPRWHVSLENMLGQYVQDERLKTALCVPGWLYGVSPEDVPFLLHARVAGSHFDSIRMFEGGGLALVQGCEKRLKEENVTLLCGRAVTGITLSAASTVSGVRLEDGEELAADIVLHTGHPAHLAAMLPAGAMRPAFVNRLARLQDTISAHILFLSAENCPEALRKKNMLVLRKDETFQQAFTPGRTPQQGPFYILASPTEQADPKGGASRTAVVAVALSPEEEYRPFYGSRQGKRPEAYKALKKERLDAFAESLFAACPDLSGLSVVDGATPLTLHDYLYSPHCGLYGAAHNLSQFNPLPVTRLPNVYAAGQAVVAPGLMGAAISAFLACGFIVGHEKLLDEVRVCRKGV